LSLFAVACASTASASIFERDDRISTVEANMPVGVIGAGWLAYGSGFLIDKCHVLTARHVIGRGKAIGKRTRFRLEPWTESTHENTSNGTVIAAGDAQTTPADYSNDWALLRLDRCLGARFGYYPVSAEGFYLFGGTGRVGPALIGIGYPRDRGARQLTIDPACEARQRTKFGLRHDCAVIPGGSGGPLVTWNSGRSRHEAVGINVAGFRSRSAVAFSLERANVAVELAPIRETIERARFANEGVQARICEDLVKAVPPACIVRSGPMPATTSG